MKCKECKKYHFFTWLEEITSHILPTIKIPSRVENLLNILLEKPLIFFKIATFEKDFTKNNVQLRTICFIKEMEKQGADFFVLKSFFGFTNYFKINWRNKTFRFNGLPIADFKSKNEIIDDKALTKKYLEKGYFPISKGRSFWFWQKKKAFLFSKELNSPLVVKPRGGSVSYHVTTNIKNNKDLKKAINHAISYSPCFIIEEFISDSFVFRATVIDFNSVFCVQQVPANVIGDGFSTIEKLIEIKNKNRGSTDQKGIILYKILKDKTTEKLLQEKKYNYQTILKKDELFYLQKDSFLKLGGDLIEVTPNVHPDNIQLFKDLVRFFDIKVTGIDFIAKDITVSWKKQKCAILELNSLPCIELHHFPSSGKPTNPSKALAKMFFKYYS